MKILTIYFFPSSCYLIPPLQHPVLRCPLFIYFSSGSVSFICFTLEAEDWTCFPCVITDCCTPEQPHMLCWNFNLSPLNKSKYEILQTPAGWPSIDRQPGYPKPFSCKFTIFTHVFCGLSHLF